MRPHPPRIRRIRAELNKPTRAYVSVAEFCQYTHLPEEEVSRALNGTPASVKHRST